MLCYDLACVSKLLEEQHETCTHTHTHRHIGWRVAGTRSDTWEIWRMHQTALDALIFGGHGIRDVLKRNISINMIVGDLNINMKGKIWTGAA